MSWLRIIHETAYRYKKAVHFGPHRLVLRPREGHDVRVERMKLTISPEFELAWSRDVFGNSVATIHLLEPADMLSIRSEVLLHHTLPFPLRSGRRSEPVPFPVTFSGLEATVAAAYQTSTFPDDIAPVRAWLEKACPLGDSRTAEEAVRAVGLAIRRTLGYRRRETRGVQSPTETLAVGTGSCRDLATLMLEALRALGFPARFASGYLDCAASEAGRASTHAWAEAYLPELGWTGFDPTLGEPTSAKHVVVGVSNHPRGVMPISGSFYGDQSSYENMTVAVLTERLGEAPTVS